MGTENKKLKFCPNCGTKILENSKFCDNCGKKLFEGELDESDLDNQIETATLNSNVDSNVKHKKKKSRGKKILQLLGIIAAIISLTALFIAIGESLSGPDFSEDIIGTWTYYEDDSDSAMETIEDFFEEEKEIIGYVDVDDVDFNVLVKCEFHSDGTYSIFCDKASVVEWHKKVIGVIYDAEKEYVTNLIEEYGLDMTSEEAMAEMGFDELLDDITFEDLGVTDEDLVYGSGYYKVLDDWLIASDKKISISSKGNLDKSKSRYIVIDFVDGSLVFKEAVNYNNPLISEEYSDDNEKDITKMMPIILTRAN